MFIVDDPMLALITRFVFDAAHLDVSDREFLQEQVRSIRQYVDQYPEDERQARAIEWVEEHAQQYRTAWQRRVISDRVTQQRCPDCPLIKENPSARCEIHARWASLLHEYLGNQISSRQYVEDTLVLLNAHKTQLKVAKREES